MSPIAVSHYPNPTRGLLMLEAPGIQHQTLEVYDVHGRLVLSQSVSPKMEVSLQDVANGIYLLKIGNWKGKVVKEN